MLKSKKKKRKRDYKLRVSTFHLPDAGVQFSLQVGVKVVSQHSVSTMKLH